MLSGIFMAQHRGPDSTQTIIDNECFGFHRLSITAVSDKTLINHIIFNGLLCFNGEIFNFKECISFLGPQIHTEDQSDTHLLGFILSNFSDCLNYVDGMFSIVIIDQKRNVYSLPVIVMV